MENLGPGARGMKVRAAQRMLNRALRGVSGFHRLADDGIYGRRTEDAVNLLQERNLLSREQGYIGTGTWRAMGLSVEVERDVTMVPQHYENGCWTASAAMVMGVEASISPGDAHLILPTDRNDPRWGQLSIENDDIIAFASHIGGRAVVVPPTVERLATYLRIRPIWVAGHWNDGHGHSGGHVVVISALWGDGTNEGSVIRVHDPWPVNQGAIYGTIWPQMRLVVGGRFYPFALGVGL